MTMVPAPDLMYQCLPSIVYSDMHGAGDLCRLAAGRV